MEFEKDVQKLREEIKEFQESIEDGLNKEITKNRKTLVTALLPAVQKRHPDRWNKHIHSNDKKEMNKEIKNLLEQEIANAFETAKKVIDEMDVSLIFKGITYELLNDDKFRVAAKEASPTLIFLHWEKTGVVSEDKKPKQMEMDLA